MTYLKQFARNRRAREKTKVLTARLPVSLYDEFQTYCDEIGLSISEAICLLVDKEVSGIQLETRDMPIEAKTDGDKSKINTGEYKINTSSGELNTIERNNAIKAKRNTGKTTTGRFLTTPFQVNNELPCPLCGKWLNHKNYARHADQHGGKSSEQLLTENPDKVQAMIESRLAELEAKQEENQ